MISFVVVIVSINFLQLVTQRLHKSMFEIIREKMLPPLRNMPIPRDLILYLPIFNNI